MHMKSPTRRRREAVSIKRVTRQGCGTLQASYPHTGPSLRKRSQTCRRAQLHHLTFADYLHRCGLTVIGQIRVIDGVRRTNTRRQVGGLATCTHDFSNDFCCDCLTHSDVGVFARRRVGIDAKIADLGGGAHLFVRGWLHL